MTSYNAIMGDHVVRGALCNVWKKMMFIVYKRPFPKAKAGINRNIHPNTIAAVSRLGFGLPGSLESSLSITVISGTAIPKKKKNTIMNRFAMDGDLN